MKTGVIVLSVVVALFGVASAVLGFIGEGTKLAPGDIKISRNECVYPDNPAYALGLVAALLLLVAQTTASAVGGCCGCCKPRGAGFSGSKRSRSKRIIGVGVVLCLGSWIVALIAEWFLRGAFWNAPIARGTAQGRGCYYLKDGVFTMGAILSIVATVLAIISYITLCAAAGGATTTTTTLGMGAVAGPSSSAGKTKPDGIAIGQPDASQQHAQAV